MKSKIIILLLIFPLNFLIGQNSQGNVTNSIALLQNIINEVNIEKIESSGEIDGSYYFFKTPSDANIKLYNSERALRIKVNYNIRKDNFEFKSGEDFYTLSTDKAQSVVFANHRFIVFNSKFYELITKNDKFSILKSHFVEAIQPKYQPGIEDKPNLRYRKANMLNVVINNKISQIKSNKKAIIALFSKSVQKKVKSFIKSNKINIRDSKDLKVLFDKFKDQFQIQTLSSQQILEDHPLSKTIEETSGLEIIDNMLITHNDSGGEPALYYLDKEGKIVDTRKITGVKNNDWEDVTRDDEFIYVANMGNNFDTRKNLSIIKIPIKKSLNETVEVINFLYPEQKKFNTIYSKSQYDAEGIVSINDDLIIFTKNKLKKITEVYSLPKTSKSIVTGSDYNNKLKLLALTSTINFKKYYLILIKDFSLKNKRHQIETYEIPIGKTQVEAVKIINKNTFWISSEDESSSKYARLLKLKI